MSRFNAADMLTPHPLARVSNVSLSNSSKYTGNGFVGLAFIIDYLVDIKTISWYYWDINSQTNPMQVRWNYKLQPNKGQTALMDEWLVTLRKHRNYCLAERKRGFETNNQDADEPIMYLWGSYCELDTRFVSGSYSPLTCPVLKLIEMGRSLSVKNAVISIMQTRKHLGRS